MNPLVITADRLWDGSRTQAQPAPRRLPAPPPPPPTTTRRRFVPHPDDEFTQLIPVLPPVPRAEQVEDELERREGAPGARVPPTR